MQSNDLINGVFEVLGGCLCWVNAWKLRRDKEVKGVMWQVTAFFSLWGLWNLIYYPSLGQWMSFAGGAFLVLGNTAWVVMALRYKDKHDTNKSVQNRRTRQDNRKAEDAVPRHSASRPA